MSLNEGLDEEKVGKATLTTTLSTFSESKIEILLY